MKQQLIRLIYPVGAVILLVLLFRLAKLMTGASSSMLSISLTILILGLLGVLFLRVLKQRLENKEDDYYSNNIKQ